MTIDTTNGSSFSNDATKKILGVEYQKLIALECCFNAKPGDIIYIECYGDIATKDQIIETKNHLNTFVMTDQSLDFWKTLRNFVLEKEITEHYSKLILHTTAIVTNSSIFSNWNEKSNEVKFMLIEQIGSKPNKSIEKYSQFVFSFNNSYQKSDLLEILEKLEIKISQPNVIEKYQELKEHPSLLIVNEKYRDTLLEQLIGYITKKAIDDKNQWKIIRDDFVRDLQSYAKKFMTDRTPFPEVPIDLIIKDENYIFIEELKIIGLENHIEEEIINYLRTQKCSTQLIEWDSISAIKAINNFETELHGKMNDTKKLRALDISVQDILKSKTKKASQKLFYECKNFPKLVIRDVQDIEMYYQHGKMHKIVEDHKFVWRFMEEDLL